MIDDASRSVPGDPGALERYRARARELTEALAEHVALVDRGSVGGSADGWAASAGALRAAVDAFSQAERALRGSSPLDTAGPGGPADEEDDGVAWPVPDASLEEAPVVTVLGRWDYVVTDAAALVQHGRAAHLAVHPRDDHEDAVLRVPSVTAAVDAVLRGPVLEALEEAPGLEPVASASQVVQHAGSSDEELETDPFGLTRGPGPATAAPLGDLCGCGHVRDPQDRHVRFSLPDAVFEKVSAGEEVPDLWMSHDDPDSSVMLAAPGLGSFVRVLLRVRLDDGTSLTYGTWLRVPHDELLRAHEVWSAPEYVDLVLEGELGNDVAPGGVLGAHARAVVTDPDATPSIDSSNDGVLSRVLTEVWGAHLHPGA